MVGAATSSGGSRGRSHLCHWPRRRCFFCCCTSAAAGHGASATSAVGHCGRCHFCCCSFGRGRAATSAVSHGDRSHVCCWPWCAQPLVLLAMVGAATCAANHVGRSHFCCRPWCEQPFLLVATGAAGIGAAGHVGRSCFCCWRRRRSHCSRWPQGRSHIADCAQPHCRLCSAPERVRHVGPSLTKLAATSQCKHNRKRSMATCIMLKTHPTIFNMLAALSLLF